jgi:uncharacterized membrane protein
MTEEEILREFGAQTPPPSSLDVDGVLRAGRSKLRTRRWGVTAAAAVAVAVAVGGTSVALRPASGPTERVASPGPAKASSTPSATQRAAPDHAACTVSALPNSTGVMVDGMSPSGRYIAGVNDNGRIVLWNNGVAQTLPVPPGSQAKIGGVNSAGVLVGSVDRNGRREGFVYQNGQYRTLGRPSDAKNVYSWDINDRGEIVGEAEYPTSDPLDVGPVKALRWRLADTSKVDILPSAAVKWASPLDIGEDGTVAGSLDDGGAPHLWRPDGSVATPPGLNGATKGKVFRITGDWAFGWSGTTTSKSGEVIWVRWNITRATVEAVGEMLPSAVGADGTLVGTLGVPGNEGAAFWRDGKISLLPPLNGQPASEIYRASSDMKTIVGAVPSGSAIWHC